MDIEGFTYVRNGIQMGYPFVESIKSILPIVNKIFVVVGDSVDGTRKAVEDIDSKKVVIIDSVWQDEKRNNGEIFMEQSNLGLAEITSDWAFHIQADEVLHQNDINKTLEFIQLADKDDRIDGLLFPFLHFWGDYKHIRDTRKTHPFEIRVFKNNRNILSYKDSQGFRSFSDTNDLVGSKLRVIKTDIPVFHYSYTRNPKLMNKKANYFHRFWHSNDWLKENTTAQEFDYNDVDLLKTFEGTNPVYMDEFIKNKDWDFIYDPSKSNMSFKDKIFNEIRKKTGLRLFESKNYIEVK